MITTGKELQLESLGLNQINEVHRNLTVESLIEETVKNGEGIIGPRGVSIVDTGKFTGRSPKDKYIVDEASSYTEKNVEMRAINSCLLYTSQRPRYRG